MTYTEDLLRFGFSLLIFWLAVFLVSKIFPLKRYGVQVEPAYITFRSSMLKVLLYKIGDRRPRFWKTLSNLSVVSGAGLMIYAVYFLLDNILKLTQPGIQGTSLLPVLPGLTIRLYWLPYLLLAASLGIILHEAAHGIIARVENISLKSAGLAFVLTFFTGFVELDDHEFEKSPATSKLRVLSAGSFVNLVAFLFVMFMMFALFLNVPSGIVVTEVSEASPIDDAGLQQWDIIYDINGTLANMADVLSDVTPGGTLKLNTSRGILWIVTGNSTSDELLGLFSPYLVYYQSRFGLGPLFDVQLYLSVFWGVIVYSSLAIFSMLPLFPFDGDKFLFYIIKRFAGNRSKEVRMVFNVVFFGTIAGNMILSFVKYGPVLI